MRKWKVVVLAQLAELFLPTLEIRSLNPVIGKITSRTKNC